MTPHLVVGVDGGPRSWAALRWAARRARDSARDLVVAYASEFSEHLGRYGLGDELGRITVATLTREFPEVVVHTVVIDSDPVEALLSLSESADLLVLGRGRHGGSLLELSSVLNRVLTRAHRPTIVVGPVADPLPEPGTSVPRSGILLGVSASPGGVAAMRFACTEAVASSSELVALRSSVGRESSARSASTPSSPTDDEQTRLDDCVERARTEFPTVKITGTLVAQTVEAALQSQQDLTSLLVPGCLHSDGDGAPRLGPLTSWAIRTLTCPVAVVGHTP